MLSEQEHEKLFRGFSKKHYLGRSMAQISLSPLSRAITAACLAYGVFLLLAAIDQWRVVVTSFLHLWQISFSITIFLGLWLGHHALQSVRPWLEHAGLVLDLNDKDFPQIVKHTSKRLGSNYSSLMAGPLIAGGLAIACLIALHSPNDLFPYPGYLPAFVYAVLLELCVFMLHLLGATGFWLLYVFTTAARELSSLKSVNYDLVDEESMRYLSETVLRLCFYLLIIIASAMPGVAYVVFAFKDIPFVLLLGTVFGMALPTIGLALSFFGPIYYLHRMMKRAKEERLLSLRDKIRICEEGLRQNTIEASKVPAAKLDSNGEDLLAQCRALRNCYLETRRRSVWPFDMSSILKLLASTMLPVVSFFAQRIIQHVLP